MLLVPLKRKNAVYIGSLGLHLFGSLTNLNVKNCRVLKGRTDALFPNLNGIDKWSCKAKELSHLAVFTVSYLLERKASEAERKQGFDLPDYLIKHHYKAFALSKPETIEPTEQRGFFPPHYANAMPCYKILFT
jgi:hypothetical protein